MIRDKSLFPQPYAPARMQGPADDGKRLDSQSRAGSCVQSGSKKYLKIEGDDGKRLGLSESALAVASAIVKNFLN